ncbi:MAG: CaiB/BaiF CoA transferase family protein [Candidatus Flexifilum sp.]
MTHPLTGMRVLDLTRLLPGALCTLMLAELGAEVIKVESPDGGDYARWLAPQIDGEGLYFRASNHSKRSIILNLKHPEGQRVLHRLVNTADVLVEGFRPGVLARFQADADTLRALNPRLIYCSISGYGQAGPRAPVSGHDLNYAALSGLIGEMGTPQPPGGQVADVGGALIAVSGILAALLRRERIGEGCVVDAALADAALLVSGYPWVETVARRLDPDAARGVLTGRYACYNVYRAADGQAVALAALEPKFWANFCAAVSRPDLIADYLVPDRQRYLLVELEQIFALRSAAEWDALLLDADCCYSRVLPPEDLLDDAGVRQREILALDGRGGPVIHSPIRLDGIERNSGPVPGYGEHTRQILSEIGCDEAEIAALAAAGAVQLADQGRHSS